jgi:hypothetical protein
LQGEDRVEELGGEVAARAWRRGFHSQPSPHVWLSDFSKQRRAEPMWRKVPAASSFKPNCPCPARSPRTRLATAVLLLGFLALVLVLKTGEMSHVLNLLVCPAPLPPPHRYPPADAGGWPAHTPPPLCVLPADVLQAAKSLAASHAMINVVFFDSAYLLLTKNWLCNVRAIPGYISRTLLVALDRAALEGLNAFAAHNDVRLDPRQHVLLPWTQAGGAKQYGDVRGRCKRRTTHARGGGDAAGRWRIGS